MAQINIQVLLSALEEPIKKSTRPIATQIATNKFDKAKKDFLEAFINDPISQELKEGSSKQSSEIIDKGNLFGFIGFEEGKDPIGELYAYLNDNIKLQINAEYNRSTKQYEFLVEIPSKEDIKKITPMPWGTARSWVFAIESGISGLNNYFFKQKYGRSGAGFQKENNTAGGGEVFTPRKYMSQLLKFLNNSLQG